MENLREFFIWTVITTAILFGFIAFLAVWDIISMEGLLEKTILTLVILILVSIATFIGLTILDKGKK